MCQAPALQVSDHLVILSVWLSTFNNIFIYLPGCVSSYQSSTVTCDCLSVCLCACFSSSAPRHQSVNLFVMYLRSRSLSQQLAIQQQSQHQCIIALWLLIIKRSFTLLAIHLFFYPFLCCAYVVSTLYSLI